jgi:hypothetical protein
MVIFNRLSVSDNYRQTLRTTTLVLIQRTILFFLLEIFVWASLPLREEIWVGPLGPGYSMFSALLFPLIFSPRLIIGPGEKLNFDDLRI